MPKYRNPNGHVVSITLMSPRTCVNVYPHTWAPSRVPMHGLLSIELDAALARPLVAVSMLELSPEPVVVSHEPAVHVAVVSPDNCPPPLVAYAPVAQSAPAPVAPPVVEASAAPTSSTRRRFYVP